MAEPLLTKRLHISGLTPSITPEDLERRLSSFGKVKAMDGFGAVDALGDPRKFGFVTMEISAKELSKCLNVLSGSTWKGAKLRIGEARPDFRERLAQFNSQPLRPVRPKRTPTRDYGRPSSTLPLTPLSAAAAASVPGWIVTPSGRVVRPMRMRPERPLGPMRSELGGPKLKDTNGKVKKRIKPPPVRARRRLIDPTKWDSVHLKGMFLDAVTVPLPTSKDAFELPAVMTPGVGHEEDGEGTIDNVADSDVSTESALQLVQDHACDIPSAQRSPTVTFATPSRIQETRKPVNLREETIATLAMLDKMFGDKEWDERESVDEMENDETRGEKMQVEEEEDIEIVPRNFGEESKKIKDKGKGKERSAGHVRFSCGLEMDVEAPRGEDVEFGENELPARPEVLAQTAEPVPRTNLKALFAPKEDASFSLVDHLDLDIDLELDVDIPGVGILSGPSQEDGHPSQQIPQVVEFSARKSMAKAPSLVTLDPSRPLLFPTSDLLPHPYTFSNPATITQKYGTPSCFLFPLATQVRGLHHLPPSITFTRSPQDTPETIRERWEKDKSSLTHEWKKAWREARGTRRGRIGVGVETGGSF